jgi:hypothetical protein
MIWTPTNDESIPAVWGTFLGFHLDNDRLARLAAAQMTDGAAQANAATLRRAETSPRSPCRWAARLLTGWRDR